MVSSTAGDFAGDLVHDLVSDVALAAEARRGSAEARTRLIGRHGEAVATAAQAHGTDPVAALDRLLRRDPAPTGPFRVAWLHEALPATQDDTGHVATVRAAFGTLSAAWQTALWHHEVEGQGPRTIGALLGIDPEAARRATVAARAALNRAVARGHRPGVGPECLRLHTHHTTMAGAVLGTAMTRVVREHARTCDPCLPVARDLLRVEHDLRELLVAGLLGPSAQGYAATRPAPRSLRAVPATQTGVRLARRGGRPVVSLAMAGATAAVVASALVLESPIVRDPAFLPGTEAAPADSVHGGALVEAEDGTQDVIAFAAGSTVLTIPGTGAPGGRLLLDLPGGHGPGLDGGPGASGGKDGDGPSLDDGGTDPTLPGEDPGDGTPGDGGTPGGDPADPGDPGDPGNPGDPGDPGEPGDPGDGPGDEDEEAMEGSVHVDVDTSTGSVDVGVELPGEVVPPVEVSVPELPELPGPGLPLPGGNGGNDEDDEGGLGGALGGIGGTLGGALNGALGSAHGDEVVTGAPSVGGLG